MMTQNPEIRKPGNREIPRMRASDLHGLWEIMSEVCNEKGRRRFNILILILNTNLNSHHLNANLNSPHINLEEFEFEFGLRPQLEFEFV